MILYISYFLDHHDSITATDVAYCKINNHVNDTVFTKESIATEYNVKKDIDYTINGANFGRAWVRT